LRDDYRRDYDTIKNFLADGADNLIAVIRAMRPLLERYLQIRFPDEIHPQDTFGDYINAIRESSAGQLLSSMKKHISELEDIKVFTDPYMHGRDAGLQSTLSHSQVEAYAKRTIRIISS
jgi:wobble nucleotide-excising tRNase